MQENDLLLDIRELHVDYHTQGERVHAVVDLNLQIHEHETLGFVGETGAGKTSTALAILGLLPHNVGFIEKGEILFQDVDLAKLSQQELRSVRGELISMIFQDPMTALNPVMTVIDQVMEMILLHRKVDKKTAREMAINALDEVGIKEERVDNYPHEFSGGMKQRVVIAIALACQPKLIIADEPTTALDVTIQAQVLNLLKQLKDARGTSMILITHDLGVVGETCDTVAIMYFGSVVEYGKKDEVYDNPRHPYTIGLFNSIPDIEDDDIERLREIRGFPPQPTRVFKGCPFHERCDYVMPVCSTQPPPIVHFSESHYAKCFRYVEGVNHE